MYFHKKIKAHFLLIAVSCFLPACVGLPDPETRLHSAETVAESSGFSTTYTGNGAARIYSAARIGNPALPTRVYIEGDGFAYLTGYQASPDSTPLRPVLLGLAAQDAAPNVIYLGRPCQYGNTGCARADWTTHRFDERAFTALNAAIDTLKLQYGLRDLELVGYSGGAHFAALLAVRRCDVAGLRSLAGNLDVPSFVAYHNIDPLVVSDTGLRQADILRTIPQAHLVSRDDRVIPPGLVQAYAGSLGGTKTLVRVVDGPAHGGDWSAAWLSFISTSLPLAAEPVSGHCATSASAVLRHD